MELSAANTVDVELLVDSDNDEEARDGEEEDEDDDDDDDDESVSRSSLELVSTDTTLSGLYLSMSWPQSSTFFGAIPAPVAPPRSALNLIGGWLLGLAWLSISVFDV